MGTPPRLEGALSARLLLRVVAYAEARGVDPRALCRGAGLSLELLSSPEARVPYAAAEALGLRAAALAQDSNFGLHLAQTVGDREHLDAGLLLVMASPTVRAGLERVVRYQRFWGDGERTSLHPDPLGLCVRYSMRSSPEGRRHADECAAAEFVLGLRQLTGTELSPAQVRFAHPAPADTTEHEALFRAPLRWSAPHTEVLLTEPQLALPMPQANETYAGIFEAQVQRALASLPAEAGLRAEVREAARAALLGGECTLERTARALRLHPRALQRQLQRAGTTFAALVDALRRELALEHLARGTSPTELAFLLGFAEPSAFFRAFKRWTGTTPERYRLHGAPASPTASASVARGH